MQDFIPVNIQEEARKKLVDFPELLISHNKSIVDEIYNLVELLEFLEVLTKE